MNAARDFVIQAFKARGANFPVVAACNYQEHWATCDVGALASANGGVVPNEVQLFVGNQGTPLGMDRQLSPADTSLTTNGQIPSAEVFVMTGLGVYMEPVATFEFDQSPKMLGAPPFVVQRFLMGAWLRSVFNQNNSRTWGSLADWPASDTGPRMGAASQTTNNAALVDTSARGSVKMFGDPETSVIYGPQQTFQHVIGWGGDPDFYLTQSGGAPSQTNPKIESWRLRFRAVGIGLTGVQG